MELTLVQQTLLLILKKQGFKEKVVDHVMRELQTEIQQQIMIMFLFHTKDEIMSQETLVNLTRDIATEFKR